MRAFFFQVVKCSDTSNGVFETKFGDLPVSSEKHKVFSIALVLKPLQIYTRNIV